MNGKTPYEVPAEMRELAERSVEQARKAFDGFIGATRKALDTAHGSADTARLNAQDASHKAIAYAEDNVAAALDLAQKLVKSKDLREVMQHQSDFLKTQIAALQAQFRDMGTAAQDLAAKAAETAKTTTKAK